MRERVRVPAACAAVLLAALALTGQVTSQAATIQVNSNITTSATWTADNEYVLTGVIFVTDGATLTIEAGTVVRGGPQTAPGANDPGTLVIARGAKIRALGTADAPVVFTDLFDDNVGENPGTAPYNNKFDVLGLTGQWGGLILLGRSFVANDTADGPNAAREVQIEGLDDPGGLGLYGNGGNDDDDSGELRFVSIRYGGFNLSPNNEINGLTLGAVGRSTDIDYVEVLQNKDDGIEFFGGTVNIKHAIVANVGDDAIDYDEGFRGKGQFLFVVQGTPGEDRSDKGGEHDGGNNPDASQPTSVPAFYNATFIGLGQKSYSNRARNTGLHIRDNAGARYYNSAFLDFGGSPACIEGDPAGVDSSGARTVTQMALGICEPSANPPTYCNSDADCGGDTCTPFYSTLESGLQLEFDQNMFHCFGNGPNLPSNSTEALAAGCDEKDHYGTVDDGYDLFAGGVNQYLDCLDDLPILALDRIPSGLASAPDLIQFVDPLPTEDSPLIATERATPADGFFSPAPYKGAFGNANWAEGWSTMSRLGYFPPKQQVLVTSNVTESTTWTADKDYVLTSVIFVTDGATLTIEPGTVVRGQGQSAPGVNDPGTLVIARGAKIRALGTADAPIVFTDLNDDNVGDDPGKPPYDNRLNALGLTSQWGGLILLGRGFAANDTASGPNAAREVQIEGLDDPGGLGLYGGGGDDDDDSGELRYVSIRYGGSNLSPNNEINGLTLGAVGRSTDIDYIEVLQNKDDGIEFFGGAVNLRHAIVAIPGDDAIDYDEGYRGNGQFIFVVQGIPGDDRSDKGGEHDGGNNPDASQPTSIPAFHNATFIGLGQKNYSNKARNTAFHIRDNAGARYYNSAFLDFGGSTMIIEGDPTDEDSSGARAVTPMTFGICEPSANPPVYCNTDADCGGGTCVPYFNRLDSGLQLEFEDNLFWCFGSGAVLPQDPASSLAAGGDEKDAYDPGIFSNAALDNTYQGCVEVLPIRALRRIDAGTASTPDPVLDVDPRPRGDGNLVATDRVAPANGFFKAVAFKGAFSSTSNWARGWSAMDRLGYFPSCSPANPLSVSEPARDLVFGADKTQLSWVGLDGARYDVLRKGGSAAIDAATFADAECLESDDSMDSMAEDPTVPASAQVLFYLVRNDDDCGGNVGSDALGRERIARDCP